MVLILPCDEGEEEFGEGAEKEESVPEIKDFSCDCDCVGIEEDVDVGVIVGEENIMEEGEDSVRLF